MAKWLPPNAPAGPSPGCRSRRQLSHVVHQDYDGPGHAVATMWNWFQTNDCAYTDKFDDPNLPGVMQTTVTLRGFCGTELNVVQEGIPEVIPAEACYLG
ncbi:MAG: hypothetical protein U0872_01895 [Planctomycetaceae bacterium]